MKKITKGIIGIAAAVVITGSLAACGTNATSTDTAAPTDTSASTPTPTPATTPKTVTRAPCTAITAGSTDPIFEQSNLKPVITGTTMVPVGESAWAITVQFLDDTPAGHNNATWITQSGTIYNGDPASAEITDWPQYDLSGVDMTDLGKRVTDCIIAN